jgi:hypothetical protein
MSRSLTNFSRAQYGKLLDEFIAAGYRTIDFPEAAALKNFNEPRLILRHDIDFCVQEARAMAMVEAQKSLVATYFFLLRTPFYNLFTAENTKAVQEILTAGHRVGLHFDRMPYARASVGELAAALNREARILSEWFGTEIKVVSYHRPVAREIEGHAEGSYPLLNTYMEVFTKRIKYFSDSQGAFRYGHPLDSEEFRARKPIQILIHPIWWGDSETPPLERLRSFLASRNAQAEVDTAVNCKVMRVEHLAHIIDPE